MGITFRGNNLHQWLCLSWVAGAAAFICLKESTQPGKRFMWSWVFVVTGGGGGGEEELYSHLDNLFMFLWSAFKVKGSELSSIKSDPNSRVRIEDTRYRSKQALGTHTKKVRNL